MLTRISWHSENNIVLNSRQAVFWPTLSFQDSLQVIYHDLYEDMLTAIYEIIVDLGIKKSFDSVLHETVVEGIIEIIATSSRGPQDNILHTPVSLFLDK